MFMYNMYKYVIIVIKFTYICKCWIKRGMNNG